MAEGSVSDLQLDGEARAGGTAEVWRARRDGRSFALKVLRRALTTDRGACERFAEEARLLARVRSEYVVRLHTEGRWQGRPCMLLDWVEGEGLDRALLRGPLESSALHGFGNTLLLGLAALHEAGVCHRDLTPDNVIVSGSSAVIVDLGAACETGAPRPSARRFGAPWCWSPERWAGAHGDAPSADLFAAGLLLFCALTGCAPHEGSRAPASPPLRAFLRDPAPELEGFLAQALAEEPAKRFGSARAMAERWRAVC